MTENGDEILFCPLSPWFWRRLWLAVALFGGLALFFTYDGAVGYPKTNSHADLFDAFEAGKTGGELKTSQAESPELSAAFEAGKQGKSWAVFAAARHLGEARPDRHTEGDIRQQFLFAGIFGTIALIVAVYGVAVRRRGFEAGPDWLRPPGGSRAHFGDITSVDITKWNRGITGLNCSDRTIRLDDYKFAGAGQILDRIRESRPDLEIPQSHPESDG